MILFYVYELDEVNSKGGRKVSCFLAAVSFTYTIYSPSLECVEK